MEDSTNLAAARRLEADGKEIAAIVLEHIAADAEREGRPVLLHEVGLALGPLMAAVWTLHQVAYAGNIEAARETYVKFLRAHADATDRL